MRSTEFYRSEFVGPRTKVHHIDEGNVWVLKKRDFIEDPNEFWKSKVLGLGSVHEASYGFFYAPRGRDPFYLGLFSIFGLEMVACLSFLSGVLCLGELCFT